MNPESLHTSELRQWLRNRSDHGRLEWFGEPDLCPPIVRESLRWGEAHLDWQGEEHMGLGMALSMNQVWTGGVVIHDLPISEEASEQELRQLRQLGEDLRTWLEDRNLVNAAWMAEQRHRLRENRAQAESIHSWKQESADTLRRNFGQLEPELVLAIRRNDRPEARRILNALLLRLYHLGHEELVRIKDLMAELIYLMRHTARECGATEAESPILLEPVSHVLDRIEDEEDLSPWLHRQLEGMLDAIAAAARPPSEVRARNVVAYIRENCARPLGRTEVARKAGLSDAEFSRMLKRETGDSFTTHLTRARVELAIHLLRGSGQTVQEIGYQCGFEHPSHFSRTFKKVTGKSPIAFRSER